MNQHECFDGGLQLLVVSSDDVVRIDVGRINVVINDVGLHVLGKSWLAADNSRETIVGLCDGRHFTLSEFKRYKHLRFGCHRPRE